VEWAASKPIHDPASISAGGDPMGFRLLCFWVIDPEVDFQQQKVNLKYILTFTGETLNLECKRGFPL
jgi:hypothetical protein